MAKRITNEQRILLAELMTHFASYVVAVITDDHRESREAKELLAQLNVKVDASRLRIEEPANA